MFHVFNCHGFTNDIGAPCLPAGRFVAFHNHSFVCLKPFIDVFYAYYFLSNQYMEDSIIQDLYLR